MSTETDTSDSERDYDYSDRQPDVKPPEDDVDDDQRARDAHPRDFDQRVRPWSRIDYSSAERRNTNEGDRGPAKKGPIATARTSFSPSDASPEKRAKFRRLAAANEDGGRVSDRRSIDQHENDVERFINLVTSKLACGEGVEQRVTFLLEGIDVQNELGRRTSIEGAVLGITSLVIDEQRSRGGVPSEVEHEDVIENPKVTSCLNDDAFNELLEGWETDRSTVRKVRQSVRNLEAYAD